MKIFKFLKGFIIGIGDGFKLIVYCIKSEYYKDIGNDEKYTEYKKRALALAEYFVKLSKNLGDFKYYKKYILIYNFLMEEL